MTLIDTSAWIDFFRGTPAAVARVDPLLESGGAAITGAVYAEVLSGARTRELFRHLGDQLLGLTWIDDAPGAWAAIADARFALARTGTQAAVVDLLVAVNARAAGASLLTRDRDFARIRSVIQLDVEIF
jgi:predicted nucleic acid-binding protein